MIQLFPTKLCRVELHDSKIKNLPNRWNFDDTASAAASTGGPNNLFEPLWDSSSFERLSHLVTYRLIPFSFSFIDSRHLSIYHFYFD